MHLGRRPQSLRVTSLIIEEKLELFFQSGLRCSLLFCLLWQQDFEFWLMGQTTCWRLLNPYETWKMVPKRKTLPLLKKILNGRTMLKRLVNWRCFVVVKSFSRSREMASAQQLVISDGTSSKDSVDDGRAKDAFGRSQNFLLLRTKKKSEKRRICGPERKTIHR